MTRIFSLAMLVAFLAVTGCQRSAVVVLRTPNGGKVPEVALDAKGVLHMTYGHGSDAYYVQSRDSGKTFTRPVRLNRRTTVTVGGERGPKLALGENGVIHVVWMGDYRREGGFWYTRSTDGGNTFASERNVLDAKIGGDGATIAADQEGNVFVFWLDGRLPEDLKVPTPYRSS